MARDAAVSLLGRAAVPLLEHDGDGGHDSDGSSPRCLTLLVGRWAGFGVVDDDASV
jgi:hypothetical protein